MIDTLKPYINNPMDFGDVVWNYLTYHYFNFEFISIVLFVIIVFEVIKLLVLEPLEINKRLYPYLVLILDLIACWLLYGVEFTKQGIFHFVFIVAVIDIIFTFGGQHVIEFIKKIFSKFNKLNNV